MKVRISKARLWKAIRKQCVDCMGGSFQLIEDCTCPKCSLFPYRFGKPDLRADIPEESQETNEGERKRISTSNPNPWKKG